MPKIPMNYYNCSIYKIEHIENDSLVYVGHTTNFKQRKQRHKSSCNNETDKAHHNYKVYHMIRKNGGWDMFKMIEIELYPCRNKREAERRESEMMKELKANMNSINPFSYSAEVKKKILKHKEEKQLYKKIYDECMFELISL